MKNTIIVLLAIVSIGLGAVCVSQLRKAADQQAKLDALNAELEQRANEIAELQASQKFLRQQREETLEQASQLAAMLQARANAPALAQPVSRDDSTSSSPNITTNAQKAPFAEMISKMMDDPEMRKMIRAQQRVMLDTLYAPLLKKWGFTPEQANQFKDFLADNMMKGAEKAGSILGGSAGERADAAELMASEQKNFDEQLKAYLGETRYQEYKDYQETAGERAQLNQFRQQFGGDSAITDDQAEQLLAFIKEEKKKVAAKSSLSGAGSNREMQQAMMSDEAMEKLLKTQEEVNQQVYERARGVLSPVQLNAFATFQSNQLGMTRMGMTMARKFMGSQKTDAPPPEQ